MNLSNLNSSNNKFIINEVSTVTNSTITLYHSAKFTLPVEHVSTIKVDLLTSMTFNVVTNTVDSEPTFTTA